MGNKKQTLFFLLMIKTLSVVLVLAIFSQMSCFKLPAKLCSPMKNIGNKVAGDVMKCASSAMKKVKVGAKASSVAAKLKIKLPNEREMASTMVAAILSKVGCKRRLWNFKKFIHKVGHGIHKAVNKAKDVGKKVGKVAVKVGGKIKAGVKKYGGAALKLACRKIPKSFCPKTCDMGIAKIVPLMKNYKIPTKCFKTVATNSCHQACAEICKNIK